LEALFLGTAAAEGYPAIFCNCANCQRARQLGGSNIRRRSACLINDDLLIDFGPDILTAFQDNKLSLAKVKYLLVTHAHDDHLLITNLTYRRKKFCLDGLQHLDVYGSLPTIERIRSLPFGELELGLTLHPIGALDSWQMGPYTVTALEACHAPQLESLFFAIQESDKCILYATDTGPFSEQSWEALAVMRFDAAIIESTLGTSRASDSHDHHMTREQCIYHHSELRRRGLMKPKGINVAHHFSHNGNPPHADLSTMLAQQGILTAYDGMVLSAKD
jgi:phosphoribosyl 1,2-cyclic phosphate phosphodiesterase